MDEDYSSDIAALFEQVSKTKCIRCKYEDRKKPSSRFWTPDDDPELCGGCNRKRARDEEAFVRKEISRYQKLIKAKAERSLTLKLMSDQLKELKRKDKLFEGLEQREAEMEEQYKDMDARDEQRRLVVLNIRKTHEMKRKAEREEGERKRKKLDDELLPHLQKARADEI